MDSQAHYSKVETTVKKRKADTEFSCPAQKIRSFNLTTNQVNEDKCARQKERMESFKITVNNYQMNKSKMDSKPHSSKVETNDKKRKADETEFHCPAMKIRHSSVTKKETNQDKFAPSTEKMKSFKIAASKYQMNNLPKDELVKLKEAVKMQLLLHEIEKNDQKRIKLDDKIKRKSNSRKRTDKFVAQLEELDEKHKFLLNFYHPDHAQLFYNEPDNYMELIDWEKIVEDEFPKSGYSTENLRYWWWKNVLKYDIKSDKNEVGSALKKKTVQPIKRRNKVDGQELGLVLGSLFRLLTPDNDPSKTLSGESIPEELAGMGPPDHGFNEARIDVADLLPGQSQIEPKDCPRGAFPSA